MKEIKYIEKESLLAWLEYMLVDEYIIKTIADENRFPTISILKTYANDFLKKGDDIYYVDDKSINIEHGKISYINFQNGEIDEIGVDFDCGDFDKFYGMALGKYLFLDEEMAKSKLTEKII